MSFYRRMLRIPWVEHMRKKEVLKKRDNKETEAYNLKELTF